MEDDQIICFGEQSSDGVDLSWISLVRTGDLLTVRLRFFRKSLALNVSFNNYQFRVYKAVSKKILRQIDSNYFGAFNQLTPFIISEIDVPTPKFASNHLEKSFFAENFLLGMISASSESRLMSLRLREMPFGTIQYFLLI